MGTMGCQPAITTSEYARVARIASDTVKGRCSLLIGAGINPCFTKSLNLLGIEGNFNLDFEPELCTEAGRKVEAIMREIGEI